MDLDLMDIKSHILLGLLSLRAKYSEISLPEIGWKEILKLWATNQNYHLLLMGTLILLMMLGPMFV